MTLEQLLNKLIEMGRKPRGTSFSYIEIYGGYIRGIDRNISIYSSCFLHDPSLSDLCSIDSGLWQFVCENKIYKKMKRTLVFIGGYDYSNNEKEYRLMLSSIQEDKEKFLLENIKIQL